MKRFLVLLLAGLLTFSAFACGKSEGGKNEGGKKESQEVKGSEQTSGKISVFVPEGYQLHGGSITGVDDTDETQCYIQGEVPSFYDYWSIIIKDSEGEAQLAVAATKAFNDAADATVDVNKTTWTGCTYKYETALNGTVDIGALYATVNGVTYLVNFSGHAPSSAEMVKILGSIKAAE